MTCTCSFSFHEITLQCATINTNKLAIATEPSIICGHQLLNENCFLFRAAVFNQARSYIYADEELRG